MNRQLHKAQDMREDYVGQTDDHVVMTDIKVPFWAQVRIVPSHPDISEVPRPCLPLKMYQQCDNRRVEILGNKNLCEPTDHGDGAADGALEFHQVANRSFQHEVDDVYQNGRCGE